MTLSKSYRHAFADLLLASCNISLSRHSRRVQTESGYKTESYQQFDILPTTYISDELVNKVHSMEQSMIYNIQSSASKTKSSSTVTITANNFHSVDELDTSMHSLALYNSSTSSGDMNTTTDSMTVSGLISPIPAVETTSLASGDSIFRARRRRTGPAYEDLGDRSKRAKVTAGWEAVKDVLNYGDEDTYCVVQDMLERKQHLADSSKKRAYHHTEQDDGTDTVEQPLESDKKRRRYAAKEVRCVVNILDSLDEALWPGKVTQIRNGNTAVYGCLRYNQAARWVNKKRAGTVNKRPGPTVVERFERDVWGRLLLYTLEKHMNGDKEEVVIDIVASKVNFPAIDKHK